MRTHLWSLFNKLAMDTTFNPQYKPGMKKEIFNPRKVEEGRIDKKSYKIAKPDIEYIDADNMDPYDLTSDSSADEDNKEHAYQSLHKTIKEDP